MIGKANAIPMLAVKDLDRARKFYEETLGLTAKEEMGGEVGEGAADHSGADQRDFPSCHEEAVSSASLRARRDRR